jgi:spermidine synthase
MDDIERAVGPDGNELILRREAGGFVVCSEGTAMIRSADRRSEKELVTLGLGPLRDRQDVNVLLGGLGMGYALRALLDDPRVVRVDVVEHAAALCEWNRTHLSVLHHEPPLSDARVHLHQTDFAGYLRSLRYQAVPGLPAEFHGYLLIVLDLDDGPSALSRGRNEALYTEEGLSDLEQALRPGGVLALWSSQKEVELVQRLRARFQNVAEIIVPVDVPGQGLDYIYRCRRKAPAQEGVTPRNGHSPRD